jgi:hypothetical protein
VSSQQRCICENAIPEGFGHPGKENSIPGGGFSHYYVLFERHGECGEKWTKCSAFAIVLVLFQD